MKAKTKDQLRGEITTLQTECDSLKLALDETHRIITEIFSAFSNAIASELLSEKYRIAKRDSCDILASFVTNFLAELKRIAGLDIAANLKDIESFVGNMGFDEATAAVIKQRIPVFFEMNKMINEMIREGKSDEEIGKKMQEFIKKYREAEGRG